MRQAKQQITIVIIDSGKLATSPARLKLSLRTWAGLWLAGKIMSGIVGVAAPVVTVWMFVR